MSNHRQCQARVSDTWSYRDRRCENNVSRNGLCGVHHPDNIKKRRERQAVKDEAYLKTTARYRLEQAEKHNKKLEAKLDDRNIEVAWLKDSIAQKNTTRLTDRIKKLEAQLAMVGSNLNRVTAKNNKLEAALRECIDLCRYTNCGEHVTTTAKAALEEA